MAEVSNIESRVSELRTYTQQLKNPLAREIFTHAVDLVLVSWNIERAQNQNPTQQSGTSTSREMR